MNQKLKNILGGAVVLAVLLLGYAAVSFSNSYGKSIPPASFRSFTVSGEGKATTVPDIAEFSFQVVTEGGKDITASQATNTAAMNKAIAFVKADGVADKDIKTESYDISPRYQTYNCSPTSVSANVQTLVGVASSASSVSSATVSTCPPSTIVGYTVTQSVDVKIRDFSKIGDVMNGVVKNGANEVGALSFTLDDPTATQNEARTDAVAKAKAQAQAVAQASGFKIGKLLSVQESSGYRTYSSPVAMMATKSDNTAETASIQPGSQEVDITMTLQYEIE